MEQIVERMQDDSAGVSVKNVKTFMNKIPSVFTGDNDLWIYSFPIAIATCHLVWNIFLNVFFNRHRFDMLDD